MNSNKYTHHPLDNVYMLQLQTGIHIISTQIYIISSTDAYRIYFQVQEVWTWLIKVVHPACLSQAGVRMLRLIDFGRLDESVLSGSLSLPILAHPAILF